MGAANLVDAVSGSGSYSRAAAVGAGGSDAIVVTGVTVAGTIVITLKGGGTVTREVPVGSIELPYNATDVTAGTAVGGAFQALFRFAA